MDGINRAYFHKWVYTGGLILLAAALPASVFLMSVVQIMLFLNWLIEGRLKLKWRRFIANRSALVFASIYLVYLVGLFYSTDFSSGFSTLKTRLPILLFTLIVVTSDPMPRNRWRMVLLAFSASITLVSLVSLQIWISDSYTDFRELSPFISHIRMSLMVAVSVCLLVWLARKDGFYGLYFLAVWHLVYLFMLHSLSGIIALGLVALVFSIVWSGRLQSKWKGVGYTVLLILLSGTAAMLFMLWSNVRLDHGEDLQALDLQTKKGTPYLHDRLASHRENGHRVYIYIAESELREAWEQSSQLDFDGMTASGDKLRVVLYRYMTSKGLRKDFQGFQQMDDLDVLAVEQGIPNVLYKRWPWFITRLHQTLWELNIYKEERDPAGHTLAQRLEFWRAARVAIAAKPWFGWGTGDIRSASAYGLETIDSPMDFERWMKPHNQYLSYFVKFGIIGGLWILLAILYPVVREKAWKNSIFTAFLIILFVSMINEDTMDTQAGLSFFVFFYNVLLFLRMQHDPLGH